MKSLIHVFPDKSNEVIAIKAWLKKNKILFKEFESPYNPKILKKVLGGIKEVENRNYTTNTRDLLWKETIPSD